MCSIFQSTCAFAISQTVSTKEHSTTKLAESVYLIRHADAPDEFPQGNTIVIIGSNSVLVVDACYLPSSARNDITQIKKWTNKPVRYLVNTHYHLDHTNGNAIYKDAFPGLSIIGREDTRKLITNQNTKTIQRTRERYQWLKKQFELDKDTSGKSLTVEQKKALENELIALKPVYEEFENLDVVSSNLIMENNLNLDLGDRSIEIKYLGRGNTISDLVIVLPKEKIIVTGDLLVYPVPYAYLGYPSEWVSTLKRISQMDVSIIVPGHGEALKDKTYLNDLIELLQIVVTRVEQEIDNRGHTSRFPRIIEAIEAVERSIDWTKWRQKWCRGIKENEDFFDDSIRGGLLRAAFAELEAR